MNRLRYILFTSLLSGTILLGDPVDEGLTLQATEQLRIHTRSMIQAGVAALDAVRMTRAMEDRRFPEAEIIRAQETIMMALRMGLPTGPLLSKALEGLTKGVGAPEITGAMERIRSRYEHAYRRGSLLTGPGMEANRTGDGIAEALAAGLTEGDADRILQRLRTRDRARIHPLAQASYLAARVMAGHRVPSGTVADALCSALQAGYQVQDMERLRTLFMKRARQESPIQVATQYLKRIQMGQPLESASGAVPQAHGGGSPQPGGPAGNGNAGHGNASKGKN